MTFGRLNRAQDGFLTSLGFNERINLHKKDREECLELRRIYIFRLYKEAVCVCKDVAYTHNHTQFDCVFKVRYIFSTALDLTV